MPQQLGLGAHKPPRDVDALLHDGDVQGVFTAVLPSLVAAVHDLGVQPRHTFRELHLAVEYKHQKRRLAHGAALRKQCGVGPQQRQQLPLVAGHHRAP